MASSAGAVLPIGAAQSFGSTTGIHLNQPVVGIASTPSKSDPKPMWSTPIRPAT